MRCDNWGERPPRRRAAPATRRTTRLRLGERSKHTRMAKAKAKAKACQVETRDDSQRVMGRARRQLSPEPQQARALRSCCEPAAAAPPVLSTHPLTRLSPDRTSGDKCRAPSLADQRFSQRGRANANSTP
mmetsp:Transcript_4042/g.6329  ORF Transcript_4042/g.6329 Transcript_4042/m.6329 type:complete len:130 (+) Transcript_4042:295-684(+)